MKNIKKSAKKVTGNIFCKYCRKITSHRVSIDIGYGKVVVMCLSCLRIVHSVSLQTFDKYIQEKKDSIKKIKIAVLDDIKSLDSAKQDLINKFIEKVDGK